MIVGKREPYRRCQWKEISPWHCRPAAKIGISVMAHAYIILYWECHICKPHKHNPEVSQITYHCVHEKWLTIVSSGSDEYTKCSLRKPQKLVIKVNSNSSVDTVQDWWARCVGLLYTYKPLTTLSENSKYLRNYLNRNKSFEIDIVWGFDQKPSNIRDFLNCKC